MNATIKSIRIIKPDGSQELLSLPKDGVRWEIVSSDSPYHPIKFLAINECGSVVQIKEYASGYWANYITNPLF